MCRWAARGRPGAVGNAGPRGRDGGMHPPFFFVLPKKNAPCTGEVKVALCPNPAHSGRFGQVRGSCESMRQKLAMLPPGALCLSGTESVLPAFGHLGAAFRGGHRKGFTISPARSASLRAPPVYPREGNPKGRGRSPAPLSRFKGVWGKQAKRRQRRMKRACFEEAARLAAPKRGRESQCRDGVEIRNPPGFLFGGRGGTLLFSKEKCPPSPYAIMTPMVKNATVRMRKYAMSFQTYFSQRS